MLAARIHRAHQRRTELATTNTCYRIHDKGESELPGVTVERFADFAVVHDYVGMEEARALELAQALCELGARGVYLKRRKRGDRRHERPAKPRAELPLVGESAPTELEVNERGRRYWVRLADGPSTGLFLDQRDNRTRLQGSCVNQRVLNLFCYTGSFSVAAGLGAASRVTSVDSSRAALARVNDNLRLNDLPPSAHRLLRADAVQWLERAKRGPDRFDAIVLDPPTFSSEATRTFRARSQYEFMAVACFELLSPGGRLLAVTNDRGTTRSAFATALERAARQAKRRVESLDVPPPPVDCPLGVDPEAATKSILATVT
jgi:23S rRNA (cytosine1962-C5)-methyltransferase